MYCSCKLFVHIIQSLAMPLGDEFSHTHNFVGVRCTVTTKYEAYFAIIWTKTILFGCIENGGLLSWQPADRKRCHSACHSFPNLTGFTKCQIVVCCAHVSTAWWWIVHWTWSFVCRHFAWIKCLLDIWSARWWLECISMYLSISFWYPDIGNQKLANPC